jgi:uncharacterized membrane protein
MFAKLLPAMALQFLNVIASAVICLISFFVLPTYYPNYQAAGIISFMIQVLIISPCFILALTAAIAYLQTAAFRFAQRGQLKPSTLVFSLIALFAPSLLTGLVGAYMKIWSWESYIYLIIALMMLLWTFAMVKLQIWQLQQLEKTKNS